MVGISAPEIVGMLSIRGVVDLPRAVRGASEDHVRRLLLQHGLFALT